MTEIDGRGVLTLVSSEGYNIRMHANKTDPERATLSIDEVARILGIGRAGAYAAAKHGDLPVIRIGSRILVVRAALERLLASAGKKIGTESSG